MTAAAPDDAPREPDRTPLPGVSLDELPPGYIAATVSCNHNLTRLHRLMESGELDPAAAEAVRLVLLILFDTSRQQGFQLDNLGTSIDLLVQHLRSKGQP